MHFVERVDTLLNQHKITRNSLVKEIGISKNSFVNWEKGSSPSAETVSKIADYLGVSTDYLLGRTDDPAFTIPEYQYFSEHELTEEEKKKVDEYVELLIKARKN